MLTPNELAEIACTSDEIGSSDEFAAGIFVEIAPGFGLAFCPDGTVNVTGAWSLSVAPIRGDMSAPFHLHPGQVRALLHGLRLLDATSDLGQTAGAAPWESSPDNWKRGRAS